MSLHDRIRDSALRALESSDDFAKVLAFDVLTLLAERDSGRRLAEERFDAELAEIRDDLVRMQTDINGVLSWIRAATDRQWSMSGNR